MVQAAQRGEKSHDYSPAYKAQRLRLSAEQNLLISQYPLFFRAVGNPEAYPSNIAHFGIQCGRGWYPLIASAGEEIEQQLRTIWCDQSQNPDSLSAMEKMILSGSRVGYPVLPFCTDIRSVAGELTMELTQGYLCDINVWGRIHNSVQKAVVRARCTCESCGKPGKFREAYWRHVYCDECIAPLDFGARLGK